MIETDIIIIGAGPVGLFTVFEAIIETDKHGVKRIKEIKK